MSAIDPVWLVKNPQFLTTQLKPPEIVEIERGTGVEAEIKPNPAFACIFDETVLLPEAIAHDNAEIWIEFEELNRSPAGRLIK
ncbi:hypothetical protein AAFN47_22820 [Hoeflea sp. CAU 1731]